MSEPTMSKDGKTTIVVVTIALLILDLALGALAFALGPLGFLQPGEALFSFGAEAAAESPEETPALPEAPEPEEPASTRPAPAMASGRYEVTSGDTLYDIAKRVWGNEDLWPLIYIRNRPPLDHPDKISPFDILDLGDPPVGLAGPPGEDPTEPGPRAEATLAPRQELLEGYISAYRAYRRQGEKALEEGRMAASEFHVQEGRLLINKAHWLLYRGLALEPQLLDLHAEEIQARDRRVVEDYVRRFGAPAP